MYGESESKWRSFKDIHIEHCWLHGQLLARFLLHVPLIYSFGENNIKIFRWQRLQKAPTPHNRGHYINNPNNALLKGNPGKKNTKDLQSLDFPRWVTWLMTPHQKSSKIWMLHRIQAFSLKSHAALLRIAAFPVLAIEFLSDWSKLVQQIACDDCISTANHKLN